jgi:hypothetical protein
LGRSTGRKYSRALFSSLKKSEGTSDTFRDGQSWAPLVFQNVQADGTIRVDVGVVDSGDEVDLWWLEGVVSGEVDVKEENSSRVRAVVLLLPKPRSLRLREWPE